MKKLGGLRRRWLINTVGVVGTLGLVCVLIVTTVFAAYYYNGMVSDLRNRAQTTTDFFADYIDQDYKAYYQSCINYANTFEDKNTLELQFISAGGNLIATSAGNWAERAPQTPEIGESMQLRQIRHYFGQDPHTGELILAVSSPMIYSNGQIIGVLRYVTSTQLVIKQVLSVASICMFVFLLFLAIVLIINSYYIRTILVPMAKITDKAKLIAAGSYGSQITTPYDDEIGELAHTINELSVKITQNEKMQTEFISSLSHELRTPLTAINGWSETLLAGDELDPEARRGMKIIHRETQRLTEMVVELLDFTRIQDGRMTLNVRQCDIRSEFEDTVYMYSNRLSQEGILLEYVDLDTEIPEIPCDPERLRQVFLNILDNAAKHGYEGKRIEASIDCDNDTVIIRIRDFGPGIAEDELPLVKKKFYKGSSKVRGSGIGLAVCDEIVEMHGGTLTLENAPGGGTLVTVLLPATQ